MNMPLLHLSDVYENKNYVSSIHLMSPFDVLSLPAFKCLLIIHLLGLMVSKLTRFVNFMLQYKCKVILTDLFVSFAVTGWICFSIKIYPFLITGSVSSGCIVSLS